MGADPRSYQSSADWFGQNGNGSALQLLLCTKPATISPGRKEGGNLPLDSGEVLSGYLSYADYPKQKVSLGCHTSVARGHIQGLQIVLKCAVWVGVTPKTHSIGYQKLSKLRVH